MLGLKDDSGETGAICCAQGSVGAGRTLPFLRTQRPVFACRKTLRCPVENPPSLIHWGRAQDKHKVKEGLEFLPKFSVPQGPTRLKGRSAQQCLSAFTWQPRQ